MIALVANNFTGILPEGKEYKIEWFIQDTLITLLLRVKCELTGNFHTENLIIEYYSSKEAFAKKLKKALERSEEMFGIKLTENKLIEA